MVLSVFVSFSLMKRRRFIVQDRGNGIIKFDDDDDEEEVVPVVVGHIWLVSRCSDAKWDDHPRNESVRNVHVSVINQCRLYLFH
mmetsp:Transcript_9853/g.11399  ORF Transcript_9853/g.11399 Transcript_9853/m.11399 type:complete len:84 (-) Transcript_9853:1482-1733(-)